MLRGRSSSRLASAELLPGSNCLSHTNRVTPAPTVSSSRCSMSRRGLRSAPPERWKSPFGKRPWRRRLRRGAEGLAVAVVDVGRACRPGGARRELVAPSFVATVLALVVFASASVALADGRVALVVGNSTYAHIGRLPNPENDAVDVAGRFGQGFWGSALPRIQLTPLVPRS